MDEQLKKRLEESATSLLDWVESSGEFVTEQAPLIAHEIINYGFWLNLIGVITGCVFVLIGSIAAYKGFLKGFLSSKDELEIVAWSVVGALGAILTFSGVVMTYTHVPTLLQTVVAPRVYLIEYLKDLV